MSIDLSGERNPKTLEFTAAALGHAKDPVQTLIAQTIQRKRAPAVKFRLTTSGEPGYFEMEI